MPTIKGRVIDQQTGNAVPETTVSLQLLTRGRVIEELQAETEDGAYSFEIPDRLLTRHAREGLSARFLLHERRAGEAVPLATETRIERLVSRDQVIDILVDREAPRSEGGQAFGQVLTHRRTAAAQVRVVLYQIGVGQRQALGASTTDRKGRYTIAYQLRGQRQAPDLQLVAVDPGDPEREIGCSPLRIDASAHERIDLVLTAANEPPRAPEFERLTTELGKYAKRGTLARLEENGSRKDISYLAQKTGWDARLVAMASLAHDYGESRDLPPDLIYPLYRAGLPTDPDQLDRVPAETLVRTWTQAIENGIADPKYQEALPKFAEQFTAAAARAQLKARNGVALSSYGEMLNLSLGDDAEAQERFMTRYLARADDRELFWKEMEEELGGPTVRRLKRDGKLGFLTLNNAPLMARLNGRANGSSDLTDLVDQGLYRAEAWNELLNDNIPVPQEMPGKTDEDKRAHYARLLAAQLRLGYPERVLATQIEGEEIPLKLPGRPREAVTQFLKNEDDFQIGGTPVEQYLIDREIRLADDDRVHAEALRGVKQLQRVYQLTPSDGAMHALLEAGIDSAYAIVQQDADTFVDRFAKRMGGEKVARMTYAKARQVHGTVLNVAMAYGTYRRTPDVYAIASLHPEHAEPGARGLSLGSLTSDVLAYPTLEELFGEMDFCSCRHCRSVLSPAAYLVDLLSYIDQTENLEGKQNPIEVFLGRRPDIQHLALTCENTNTVLPYIDLVNEILEHQVVHGDLNTFVGFNTDPDSTTEELLANPQFVNDAAYTMLASRVYPLSLPYHDALFQLRGYLEHLETPLDEVLPIVRRPETDPSDGIMVAQERLGLSPPAFAALVSHAQALPLHYGFQSGDDVHAELQAGGSFAKDLSRRLGVSYAELTDLVKTYWINPAQWIIQPLEGLYVALPRIIDLLDGNLTPAQFNGLLPESFDATPYGGDAVAWLQAREAAIRSLILLVHPDGAQDECNFAELEWQRADGQAPGGLAYWKLVRFVRLWRALGWTIEQVDQALRTLYPAGNGASTIAELNAGMQTSLLRLGHLMELMERLRLKPKRDLGRILPLWSDIGTIGKEALYRRLFLNGSMQTDEAVFGADGNGEYLQDASVQMGDHLPALQAALRIKAQDMQRLLARLGMSGSTPLTLSNVSALYRRAFLARSLRLSILELEILEDLSGLDPYSPLEDLSPTTLRLVRLAEKLRDHKVKLVNLDYFLRHVDHSGKASPTRADRLALARALRQALAAVEQQTTGVSDPQGVQARAVLTQVFGAASADRFFGLLDESAVFTTSYDHSAAALEPAIGAVDAKLRYDDFAKRLSYPGVLSLSTRNALQAVAGVSTAFQNAVGELYTQSQQLFDQHASLGQLYESTFAALSVEDRKAQYGAILTSLLPVVLPRLKRISLRQQLLGALDADPERLKAILEDERVAHAANPDEPLIETFLTLDTGGFSEDSPAAGQTRLRAYVDPPSSTFFNIYVETDASAVAVEVDGQTVAGTLAGGVWSNDAAIALTAGKLAQLSIVATGATGAPVAKWAATGLGKAVIPDTKLYPHAGIEAFTEAYLRLLKGLALTDALQLEPEEMLHYATFPLAVGPSTEDIPWINALPAPTQATAATPTDVFHHLIDLLRYVELRTDLNAAGKDLIAILQDPAALNEQGDSRLWLLTGWVENERDALLAHYGWTLNDLDQVDRLRRLQDAFEVLEATGLSAAMLLDVGTNDPSAAVVRSLQAALRARYDQSNWLKAAGPLHDAHRNRRRDVLVDHVLHQFSLQAATEHIDTANKLFEYFLIDVEMDACMKTSRIKQALSSVQLFVYRVFLNLEKNVSPKALNAKRWEWMKRYRVWEANRKVFLYPENWLEPELRDNKSPFFKELESELLQTDVTDEKAAVALRKYLEKLDEVAKLEICGTFLQENQIKKDGAYYAADDILHVIGRTSGANRRYYYRRYEYGYWTPWERIDLEIEDNPVLPVVWNDRLFLFWLSVMTKGEVNSAPAIEIPSGGSLDDATFKSSTNKTFKVRVEATLCYSSYLDGGWQPQKTSDIGEPMQLGSFVAETFPRQDLALDAVFPGSGGVAIYVSNPVHTALPYGYFRLYNKHSLPVLAKDDDSTMLEKWLMLCNSFNSRTNRQFRAEGKQFTLTYNVAFFEQLDEYKTEYLKHVILKRAPLHRIVFPAHYVRFLLEAPFFFQDRRHVFHVLPEESLVTVATTLDFGYAGPEPAVEFVKPDIIWEEKEIFDPEIYQALDPLINTGLFPEPDLVDPGALEGRFDQSALEQGLFRNQAVNFKGTLIAATGAVDPQELAANNLQLPDSFTNF